MSLCDITDVDLVDGSKGVEAEEHFSSRCKPLMEYGIYMRGFRNIGKVVAYFRYCECEFEESDSDKTEYKTVLEQFRTSGIPLPTNGVDIHRNNKCSYCVNQREKTDLETGRKKTVYLFHLKCFCKSRDRTTKVYN
jgi:hypothetical protein